MDAITPPDDVDLFDDPTVGGLVVTGHDISDRLCAAFQAALVAEVVEQ